MDYTSEEIKLKDRLAKVFSKHITGIQWQYGLDEILAKAVIFEMKKIATEKDTQLVTDIVKL